MRCVRFWSRIKEILEDEVNNTIDLFVEHVNVGY